MSSDDVIDFEVEKMKRGATMTPWRDLNEYYNGAFGMFLEELNKDNSKENTLQKIVWMAANMLSTTFFLAFAESDIFHEEALKFEAKSLIDTFAKDAANNLEIKFKMFLSKTLRINEIDIGKID